MDKIITAKLNDFMDESMELYDLPGLAVGVSFGLDNPRCFTAVRGWRDYTACSSKGKSLYPDTYRSGAELHSGDIFHCASVSKLFTSSAIMKLVEAGVLGLYDRLSNILPDLKSGISTEHALHLGTTPCIADWRFDEIRLWNLLTHTSGLADCNDYEWEGAETDDASLARYVYTHHDCIGQSMLWCPQTNPEFYGVPETDENGYLLIDETGKAKNLFRYSNVAYEILGQIVAEYSDRMPGAEGALSYEDFVKKYLLEPAGMSSSTMKTFERPGWSSKVSDIRNQAGCIKDAVMALPHEKKSDRSIGLVETYPYTRKHAPSSTLSSDLEDLMKWGRAHMKSASGQDELLLHKETYDTIWRDYATVPNNGEKMGLGWFMRKQAVEKAGCTENAAETGKLCSSDCKQEYLLLGHEGTDDGFRASFWMCPKLDMVTVVLSNLSNAPVKRINRKLFELMVK